MGKSGANSRKQPSSSKTGQQNTRKKVKRLGKNSIQTYLKPHNLKDENIYNCLNVENSKNIKEKAKQPEKKPSKPQPVIVTDKNCRIDKHFLRDWHRQIQLQNHVNRLQSVLG